MPAQNREEAYEYFNIAILKYNKGNIEELLSKEVKNAGSFLTLICNGIDNLGGMCFGYDNVGVRFKKFMQEKMGITEKLSEYFYKVVRCGVVHQGMPKIGTKYYCNYYEPIIGKEAIFSRKSNQYIYLNVYELIHHYLKTIEDIASCPENHIYYKPDPEEPLQEIFERAKEEINVDAENLEYEIMNKYREEGGSLSAYIPDNTYAFCKDLIEK